MVARQGKKEKKKNNDGDFRILELRVLAPSMTLLDLGEYTRALGGQLCVVSKMGLPTGAYFCDVFTQVPVPASTWSSIQTGKATHKEFNSAVRWSSRLLRLILAAATSCTENAAPSSATEFSSFI